MISVAFSFLGLEMAINKTDFPESYFGYTKYVKSCNRYKALDFPESVF